MIVGLVVFFVACCCLAGYRISLSVHPYTNCKRCNGNGRNSGSTRTKFGNCRACGGRGRKERFGRWLLGLNKDR